MSKIDINTQDVIDSYSELLRERDNKIVLLMAKNRTYERNLEDKMEEIDELKGVITELKELKDVEESV